LCRVLELSFFEAVRRNVPGLAAPGWQADLLAFDFDAFLASLDPSRAPRVFTIELAGEVAADLDRLQAVAATPEGAQPFHDVALDARGRFDAAEPLLELQAKLQALPALRPLAQKLRYIEQPIRPSLALSLDVSELAERVPLVLDESDDSLEALPRARRLGYTGVTARAGKGLHRALLNAARCSLWNAEEGAARYFVVGLGELAGSQVPANEENSIP
jgi:L-alanine-DL-glutamate epimerase-like enolase superfamily enzyme